MEEVKDGAEEVAGNVVEAVLTIKPSVAWRWREQGIPDFLEDMSTALRGLGDVLDGLVQTPEKEVTLQVNALVLLSGLALALSDEAMEARSYYVQQNPDFEKGE